MINSIPCLRQLSPYKGVPPPPPGYDLTGSPQSERLEQAISLIGQFSSTPVSQGLRDFCSWAGPGHRSLIKNKTQTAVINIASFRIFINVTFRMLFNIRNFQK